MKQKTVFGHYAPAPRPTYLAAALVALPCALAAGVLIWLVETMFW